MDRQDRPFKESNSALIDLFRSQRKTLAQHQIEEPEPSGSTSKHPSTTKP